MTRVAMKSAHEGYLNVKYKNVFINRVPAMHMKVKVKDNGRKG